ncbi:Vacuolar protein sorting-associated protein ist1 [Cryptotrichosporon argae]
MPPWNAPRARVQIKLSIQRLRTLQEKHLALAKKSRREIADLVARGRAETAKLRVEGIIQDDIHVELLELLELYAEKLQARFNVLDASTGTEPDPSIADAVSAIVYAAPRTELKELHVLREILMHKFGRAFSLAHIPPEPAPPTVPARILSKLALFTPAPELVDAYLAEIARGYGVAYVGGAAPASLELDVAADQDGGGKDAGGKGGDARGGPGDGQEKVYAAREPALAVPAEADKAAPGRTSPAPLPLVPPATASSTASPAPRKSDEDAELARRFERLKNLK